MSKVSRAEYYEKAFELLEKEHKRTWNWAALFLSSFWLLYRKMYLYSFIYCIFSLIAATLAKADNIVFITLSVVINLTISLYLGYYGNDLYYRIIKKRISKGYHLLNKYSPTSIPSCLLICFSGGIVSFADYISRKLQLRGCTDKKTNIDNESIRNYLNPNRKNHRIVKIANILICFMITFILLVPAIRIIGDNINEKLMEKQTTTKIIPNTNKIMEV